MLQLSFLSVKYELKSKSLYFGKVNILPILHFAPPGKTERRKLNHKEIMWKIESVCYHSGKD